jgi:hypothetical protein
MQTKVYGTAESCTVVCNWYVGLGARRLRWPGGTPAHVSIVNCQLSNVDLQKHHSTQRNFALIDSSIPERGVDVVNDVVTASRDSGSISALALGAREEEEEEEEEDGQH